MIQSDISGIIDPIWLKRQGPRIDFAQRMHARENACRPFSFVLLSELWPGIATKKIQPDRLICSGDIALDHNGTFGLERRYIWTSTPKDFPPVLSWDGVWSSLWPPKLRPFGTTFINEKCSNLKNIFLFTPTFKLDKEKFGYFSDWSNFLLMNVVSNSFHFGGQRHSQFAFLLKTI